MSALAIWQAVQLGFGFIAKHWKWALVGALLLYVAVLKAEQRHEHKLRVNAELSADMCAKGRAADRQAYVDGQAAVRLQHEAQKRADEKLHETIRKDADNALKPQLDAARQRLADYARLHPASGAAESAAIGAGVPGHPQSAGQPDRPGDPAIMVSLDDANRCTEAAVRLLNARDWALSIKGTEK